MSAPINFPIGPSHEFNGTHISVIVLVTPLSGVSIAASVYTSFVSMLKKLVSLFLEIRKKKNSDIRNFSCSIFFNKFLMILLPRETEKILFFVTIVALHLANLKISPKNLIQISIGADFV